MDSRKVILVCVVVAIIGAIVYLENQKVEPVYSTEEPTKVNPAKDQVKVINGTAYPLSPELNSISGYINTLEDTKISDFEGKVVLIDFWTYTCINCIRTLPYLTAWDEKYRDKGLVIIGVHAPEFEFEKEKENVEKAVEKYGIKYPVVQDNDRGTWNAFKNRYWPAKYLIDSEGYIRYVHFGEGSYEETENKIKELLEEAGEDTSNINVTEETKGNHNAITPELYAGAVFALPRGQYIGNKKTTIRNEYYVLPNELDERDVIYLDGNWTHNADNLKLEGKNGTIALDFTASEVNIVASPLNQNNTMDVLIDGRYIDEEHAGDDVQFEGTRSFVNVNGDRLYNIYKGSYGEHRLDLKVREGFSFNAFTFG